MSEKRIEMFSMDVMEVMRDFPNGFPTNSESR